MATEVLVTEFPPCDIHKMAGIPAEAHYDSKTNYGPWAFLCEACFRHYGPGKLGTGFAQRLVLAEKDA